MKITRGFTLIELLVVMGIIAILAVMTAPEFLVMQNRAKFRDDVQKFQDLLGEARSNALSNKNCGNGETSLKWSVYLREGGNDFELYCQWDDGTADLKAMKEDNQGDFTLTKVSKLELVESEGNDYAFNNSAQGFVLISYISGTGQTKIETFGENGGVTPAGSSPYMPLANLDNFNGNNQKDIRVVFLWSRSTLPEEASKNEVIIVCMDAVAGFPRKKEISGENQKTCPDK
jgi:prepilin-type N-terminal cleavage/methylation domain-containing protein